MPRPNLFHHEGFGGLFWGLGGFIGGQCLSRSRAFHSSDNRAILSALATPPSYGFIPACLSSANISLRIARHRAKFPSPSPPPSPFPSFVGGAGGLILPPPRYRRAPWINERRSLRWGRGRVQPEKIDKVYRNISHKCIKV